MEELQDYTEKDESTFDLKAEIYKYLAHWKWLVFGCLFGLLVAYLYNRYTIPEYSTEASMMILREEESNVAGALPSGGAAFLSLGENSLENYIVTLSSKRMVGDVVDQLDLNISYFKEGKVIDVEAYPKAPVGIQFLSPQEKVNASAMKIVVSPRSTTSFVLKQEEQKFSETFNYGEPISFDGLEFIIVKNEEEIDEDLDVKIVLTPLWDVVNSFIWRMTIRPKGQAKDILSLSIVGEVPEKSQDFLNALMKNFNIEGVEDKRQVAENTTRFIQNRLALISAELDSVEGGIAEFKRENEIMNVTSSAERFLAKSSSAEQEIFDLETQALLLDTVKDALRESKPYTLLPANFGTEGGAVSGLVSTYNQVVLERNALLRSGTAKNPAIETLTAQLDALRENILENIASSERSLEVRLTELNQLDQRAEGKFNSFPGLEKGIRSIERQQQIKEQLYLFLLQRREESAISFAATSPVAKVIDPAWTHEKPVDPKPILILAGGGFAGFLIPLLVIFVINFLDTKVHHKGDLLTLTKTVPFLGEIPRVENEEEEVIQINDRSPLAESFRILRTNLAYLVQSRNQSRAEVVFVTSTVKGEGKTFVSYNLARTLASTGKRILIVGADVRNPKLQKYADQEVPEAKGLSDYLYDHKVDPEEIIIRENQDNIPIDVVFSGAIPPNPAELLMNDRMKELLKDQEKNYDFIIVDTAPTMIVTDTLLISPLADTTIYIARAGFTEKKLLEHPKELRQQGKLKGLAVVLNDVDYSKFSYGAKYGYAYGYGYGYGPDKEDKGWINFIKKPFK